jgi:hypothetical protein
MRRLVAIVLPLFLVLVIAVWRSKGPAPSNASLESGRFSGDQAVSQLRALYAEQVPHPTGTAANARVRDRVIARFRELGYETTVQRRFACNAVPVCAMVENVIARHPGAQAGDAVLVVAHYDSVGAGPGVSDDGMGVAAVLEVARVVRDERLHNPVIFLVDDAEEAGLLGAEAFVADESLSKSVAAVINVENRGTYGPSNMFETSRGNRWLIRHLARSLERPQATSFFYAIYNLLPNDTDVTVFKRAGKAAVNFAAIGGVNWYHTPLDDLAHSSPRTLQHHGENVLATLRALANADLAARSETDATYFDILGFFMIWWPAEATIWIAAVSLILLMIAARKTNARAVTFGVLATFVSLIGAGLTGMGVSWLARLRSGGVNWVAHPAPSIVAMWLAGFAAALFGMALLRKRSDERAMLIGCAMVWHAIAVALCLTLNGAAFLFLVPAAIVTLCALAGADETVIGVCASTAAAILIFPMCLMLYDALGGRMMGVIAILIGAAATFFAPLFAHMRYAAAAAMLAIVAALIAVALPPVTAEKPRLLSLTYVDDADAPAAVWMTPVVTPTLRAAAPFAPADLSLTPWNRRRSLWAAPAPRVPLARVAINGRREGDRVFVRVSSQREAWRLSVAVQGGTVVRVNGVAPAPRPARFRDPSVEGWRFASAVGVNEIEVEIAATGKVDVVASETTPGLPPAGQPLARARNASLAIPAHDGDLTVTRARRTF